jgi:hypothetical protein
MAFIHMYAFLINWIDQRIDSGGATQWTKSQWYARINRDIFRALVLSYGSGWEKGQYVCTDFIVSSSLFFLDFFGVFDSFSVYVFSLD